MKFIVITSFPDFFKNSLISTLAKSLRESKWDIEIVNIQDFAIRKNIDSPPYGGGGSMVLRADVLGNAIDSLHGNYQKIICFSPRGMILNQLFCKSITTENNNILLICNRFEGIDQRVIEFYKITEISIGDYIISGSELAAMVFIDSCVRLIDGVLSAEVTLNESFNNFALEHDHYTRPSEWKGVGIPDILKSGNHQAIKKWRLDSANNLTIKRRPDLINK